MCYNCGCQNPQDDMGDKNNITEQTFEYLSKEWNKSLKDTKLTVYELLKKQFEGGNKEAKKEDPSLAEMFERAARAWRQDLTEAKKNTYEILKEQIGK